MTTEELGKEIEELLLKFNKSNNSVVTEIELKPIDISSISHIYQVIGYQIKFKTKVQSKTTR